MNWLARNPARKRKECDSEQGEICDPGFERLQQLGDGDLKRGDCHDDQWTKV
jgi:hypothetical protein